MVCNSLHEFVIVAGVCTELRDGVVEEDGNTARECKEDLHTADEPFWMELGALAGWHGFLDWMDYTTYC